MADDMDRASEFSEEFLADALADHRRRLPTGTSRTNCIDCEEEIPPARREASPGCTRCIDCQSDIETLTHRRPL